MMDDYETSTDISKKEKIAPYLKKERQKLNTSIIQILERADYILRKSNNPFNVINIAVFSIQQLYSEIRRVWNDYFDSENFELKWNVLENQIKHNVKYNTIGLELVLSNWFSNMNRYNTGVYGVIFEETNENYQVIFYNSFNNLSPNASKFIDEYMTSDRIEISRRESHGLLEVKDFLMQMNISANIYSKENNVYFTLNFLKTS